MTSTFIPVYEISINLVMTLESHSLSNLGSEGSNRLYPRKQILADGTITDALSGNILKHVHAKNMTELCFGNNVSLCKACAKGDSRRAAALADDPVNSKGLSIDRIIGNCTLCDTHGFAILAKNATAADETHREKATKSSLIGFSFALGLPGKNFETDQTFTRYGDTKETGQMIMKATSRSGQYALGVRYFSAGVGIDTHKWHKVVTDQAERKSRYIVALSALRDMMISPDGAMTAKMSPQLSGIKGVVAIKKNAGRAPVYSGLDEEFIEKLKKLRRDDCEIMEFYSIDGFSSIMDDLVLNSLPMMPNLFE